MFDIDWSDTGKRAAALFAGFWAGAMPAVRDLIGKIVPLDDSGFGADDIVKAVFYSLVVEVVFHGKSISPVRVLKRAALIAAAIFGSQTEAYQGLRNRAAAALGGSAYAVAGLDALFASVVVELGQGYLS